MFDNMWTIAFDAGCARPQASHRAMGRGSAPSRRAPLARADVGGGRLRIVYDGG